MGMNERVMGSPHCSWVSFHGKVPVSGGMQFEPAANRPMRDSMGLSISAWPLFHSGLPFTADR